MRIDAYSYVSSVAPTQTVKSTQKTGAAAKTSDKVQISSFGRDLQTAKAALAKTPDVREDVTAPIKEKIDAGTYQVSTSAFADKLMEKLGL